MDCKILYQHIDFYRGEGYEKSPRLLFNCEYGLEMWRYTSYIYSLHMDLDMKETEIIVYTCDTVDKRVHQIKLEVISICTATKSKCRNRVIYFICFSIDYFLLFQINSIINNWTNIYITIIVRNLLFLSTTTKTGRSEIYHKVRLECRAEHTACRKFHRTAEKSRNDAYE